MRSLVLCQFNKEDIVVKRLTVSGLVCDKPCWLLWVKNGRTNVSTARRFELRDGFTAVSKIIFMISSWQVGVKFKSFANPVRFKQGLYITLPVATTMVSVGFIPDY